MNEDKTEPYVSQHNIGIKTKEWLAAIGSVNTHRMRLLVPKSALIVIDMQRFFADPAGKGYLSCTAAISPNLRRLLRAFRRTRRPVIYTRHAHPSPTARYRDHGPVVAREHHRRHSRRRHHS